VEADSCTPCVPLLRWNRSLYVHVLGGVQESLRLVRRRFVEVPVVLGREQGATLSTWWACFSPRTHSSSRSLWACVPVHDSEHVRVTDAKFLRWNLTSQVVLVFDFSLGSHGSDDVRSTDTRRRVVVAGRVSNILCAVLIGPGVVVRLVVGEIRWDVLGLDVGTWSHWRPVEWSAMKASWRVDTRSTRVGTGQIVAVGCGRARNWYGESRNSGCEREPHE